jgi:GNAT superfamily N-acetyltransferase
VTLELVRIGDRLPHDFADLASEAGAEGFRNIDRLAAEFADQRDSFTALFAAYEAGRLVGIGGLTPEPGAYLGEAWRMRRFYVRTDARRRGVGRRLADALLTEALGLTRLVTVHAGSTEAARFWKALGWEPVSGRTWSHQFLTT